MEVVGHVAFNLKYRIHLGPQIQTTGSSHKLLITLMLWS